MPITLTPALHFSARTPFDRNRALWGGFMLVAIIPNFAKMFADFGAKLPLPTRIVLEASHILTRFWWVGLGSW